MNKIIANSYPKESLMNGITTKHELYDAGIQYLILTHGYSYLLKDIRQRYQWRQITKKQAFDLRQVIKKCFIQIHENEKIKTEIAK